MLNRSVSLVIGQVVIRGRVVDKVSRLPIPGYTVQLFDRGMKPPVEINLAQFRLSLKQTPEGDFGFFGIPEAIPLIKAQQYKWRVDVSVPGYKTLKKSFQFGPLGAQPEEVEFIRPVPGDAFSVRLFRAGLPVQLGDLKPDPLP